MPGSMAPLKKRRNSTRLPLALNPLKSKDVLAVLAERNQAIVPVGAWVEPASPHSSEIPASVSVSSPPWRGPHPTSLCMGLSRAQAKQPEDAGPLLSRIDPFLR